MSNQKKAKSEKTGKWIVGSLAVANLGSYIIEAAETIDGKLVVKDATLVDMGTVCDFITSTSTNEKPFAELYEHDIIKTSVSQTNPITNKLENIDLIGEILWSSDYFQWEVSTTEGDIVRLFKFIEDFGIDTIVGSYFDTPEYVEIKKARK